MQSSRWLTAEMSRQIGGSIWRTSVAGKSGGISATAKAYAQDRGNGLYAAAGSLGRILSHPGEYPSRLLLLRTAWWDAQHALFGKYLQKRILRRLLGMIPILF